MFFETVCMCVHTRAQSCICMHTSMCLHVRVYILGWIFSLLNDTSYVRVTPLLWETWVVVQVMLLSFSMSLSKLCDLSAPCTVHSISQILGRGQVVCPM